MSDEVKHQGHILANDAALRDLIIDVLKAGYLISLAIVDYGGPWVSDLIYVHDSDLSLYWISETATRHSKAIEKQAKAAGTITISNGPGVPDLCLQIEGTAERIEGDSLELSVLHRAKRGKPAPESGILEDGEAWYRFKPTMIELIHTELFGWEKKKLILKQNKE